MKTRGETKCGFLGPLGTYSHQAALALSLGKSWNLEYFSSIKELFYLDEREFQYFIVPVENSVGGGVLQTLDEIYYSKLSKLNNMRPSLLEKAPTQLIATTQNPAQSIATAPTQLTGHSKQYSNAFIQDQIELKINHCFLHRKDTKTIKRIYSHPEVPISHQTSLSLTQNCIGFDSMR